MSNAIDVPYFIVRPTSPVKAGLVVIHEGGGLTLQILRLCERLAAEGYAAAAPDLFFRTGGPAATENFMEQMTPVDADLDQMLDDLAKTAAALRAAGAERIGVMGFCMGGRYTWHAAVHGEGYDAAAAFYGSDIATKLIPPRCPTLVFFGGQDPIIPLETAAAVAAFHPDTFIYPEAGHGFMRDGSDMFVPDAAADAWDRILAHFGKHLHE
jgi:carboxymethylenebutenolidase